MRIWREINNLLCQANALCQLAESPPNRLSSMLSVSRGAQWHSMPRPIPTTSPSASTASSLRGGQETLAVPLEATRRSFNKDFLLALAADFKKHGAAAIEKVRKTQPAVYVKICAFLVPREMKLEHSGGVKAMTDEQIDDAIAAIKAWMAAQAGEAAKVIEGEAEVVPSLPAPARPTKAS